MALPENTVHGTIVTSICERLIRCKCRISLAGFVKTKEIVTVDVDAPHEGECERTNRRFAEPLPCLSFHPHYAGHSSDSGSYIIRAIVQRHLANQEFAPTHLFRVAPDTKVRNE